MRAGHLLGTSHASCNFQNRPGPHANEVARVCLPLPAARRATVIGLTPVELSVGHWVVHLGQRQEPLVGRVVALGQRYPDAGPVHRQLEEQQDVRQVWCDLQQAVQCMYSETVSGPQ